MSSSDPGSDNILVTIDYGSMEGDLSIDSLGLVEEELQENVVKTMDLLQVPPRFARMSKIKEEHSSNSLHKSSESVPTIANPFQVHHMHHSDKSKSSSATSSMDSLMSYNVDTSGDYGSWQHQSESENGDADNRRVYRYEDLIIEEMINDDSDHHDDYEDGAGDFEGDRFDGEQPDDEDYATELVDSNYDVALSARWPSDNAKLYYRSVDYLN